MTPQAQGPTNGKKPHVIKFDRQFNPQSFDLLNRLQHFFGTNPYYAIAKTRAGEVSYNPIKKELDPDILNDHIEGHVVLGTYQLDGDNNVMWLCWDVDSTDRKVAQEYATKISNRLETIPHAIEFSGSKGYHIFVFLDRPMSAVQAKQVVDFVRDAEALPKVGKSHVECYPKQDKLTSANPMGSLLKLPLGLHPKTHNRSMFVDRNNGWEAGEPIPPEHVFINVVAPEELLKLIRGHVDIHKQIVDLLAPHWAAAQGEHHNFALYLAGYFSHLGWGLQDAVEVVQNIAIACNDAEVGNRVQAVQDTFRKIEQNGTVKGFSGLSDMLPGAVVKTLSELASSVTTPTLVKRIDAIRLQRGPQFEKTRQSALTIWSDLRETGEMVQTEDNRAYWFDSSAHILVALNSTQWQAKLHHDYGLNPSDSFGTQTTEEIRLKAVSEARTVDIRNRTYWTGEELYVNLGGSEVYILDGEDVRTGFNGACGHLFLTDAHYREAVKPVFSGQTDVWKVLINDLSFNRSQDAPATPAEQSELLKAWILAFFFQELMPTKPLLLAMGVPGSGKTTAMRRVLKVLEGPDAEVLEVVGDKPDSLRASLTSHKLLVLDNLERTKAQWLVDTLNRLATGANIELRELYKTNSTFVIKPQCFVAMTAVSMPFSEETLFSRILPLEMQQLSNPLPEHLIQKKIQEELPLIWGDLLLKLNQIVATIRRDQSSIPPIASRLADFTVFCKRIERSGVVDGVTLIRGLRSLVDRQKIALLESSPFVAVLEEWMKTAPDEASQFHDFAELWATLEPIAHRRSLNWRWSNPASLGRHILAMMEPLKKLYRAEFVQEHMPNGKEIDKIKFQPS
jgi:hypothetical protein